MVINRGQHRVAGPRQIVSAVRRANPAFALDGLQPDQPFPETVPGLT